MIIPIFIDTSGITEQFSGVKKEHIDKICDNVAKGLAARYATKLSSLANDTLHQTKNKYIRAIRVLDTGRMEGTVMLDYSKDKLVKMLEEGASAFDEKIAMMASAKVKIGKNGGRYLTIPFRVGTPGAVGDSDVFTSIMPEEVYQVVKAKPTDIVNSRGTRSAGLRMNELPAQFQTPKVREAIKDSQGKILFDEYKNKSSIYAGLIKTRDGVTGDSTYSSFRRVSLRSDKLAFIHPGIERRNLIGKALADYNYQREMEIQLSNELAKLGMQ